MKKYPFKKIIAVLVFVLPAGCATGGQPERNVERLKVFGDEYPKVVNFRFMELRDSDNLLPHERQYEKWSKLISRALGNIATLQDKFYAGHSDLTLEYCRRFKREHPARIMLTHFNGCGVSPNTALAAKMYAGHWLYYNGCVVEGAIGALEGRDTIKVADTSLFLLNTGRGGRTNDDICIARLEDGRPDWSHVEQVKLLDIDRKNSTLTVKRGCYGTRPLAFEAGKAYAAPHVADGPWGGEDLLWQYNYSVVCPRDAKGRTCSDILIDYFFEQFARGGRMEFADGIAFDVLWDHLRYYVTRPVDLDADGKDDGPQANGFDKDGHNLYGIGSTRFLVRLRERMGDDFIITSDGEETDKQSTFGVLNGIESEHWPVRNDVQFKRFTGGMNRLRYAAAFSAKPRFTFNNALIHPDLPLSYQRVNIAATVLTDCVYAYRSNWRLRPDFEYYDELIGGKMNRICWLGAPVEKTRRLACETEPTFVLDVTDAKRLRPAEGTHLSAGKGSIKIAADDGDCRVTIPDVPAEAGQAMVVVTARCRPPADYPPCESRLMSVRVSPYPQDDDQRRRPDIQTTWVNNEDFVSHFYYPNASAEKIDLEITVESHEPVWISSLKVYSHPHALTRRFENGLVIANASPHPYTFDLAELYPGLKFRRIPGRKSQDPKHNNGQPVTEPVKLAPRDALFLQNQK